MSQCRQAGQGLTDLLTTPQVEHFLIGTPMSVLADKQIYKHGALRKVQCTYTAVPSVYLHAWFILIFMCHSDTQVCSQKAITIGAVTVHIAGNTSQLRDHPSVAYLDFEPSCLPGEAFYSAVRGELVHNGDYIKFEDLIGTVSTLQNGACHVL